MAALRPLDGGGIKTSRASLVGGIAVGIGVFVLWTLLARDLGGDGVLAEAIGLVFSGLVGLWIWRADL